MRRHRSRLAPAAAAAFLAAACGSNEPAANVPDVGGAAPAAVSHATPSRFQRRLELQGVTFTVSCDNDSSVSQLSIAPEGLSIDNQAISQNVDGQVVGAEVADLDANGSPEIYVFVRSAGSGSYGSLVAYAANDRKSVSAVFLPPVVENPRLAKGYMGHDEFAVVENRLVQRFPVYRDGDTNAKPTGGTRQVQYTLVAGEAGWRLVVDRVVEY